MGEDIDGKLNQCNTDKVPLLDTEALASLSMKIVLLFDLICYPYDNHRYIWIHYLNREKCGCNFLCPLALFVMTLTEHPLLSQ